MFQRLQERMNKQKVIQESEPELLSFYPEAEDGVFLPLLQLINNDVELNKMEGWYMTIN